MKFAKSLLVLVLLASSAALPLAIAVPGGHGPDGPAPAAIQPLIDIIDHRVINATYTHRIPIIDGEIGQNEWTTAGNSSALFSQMPPAWQETGANITGPGISNDSDCSHQFWAMYDDEYLYLLFNCSDDKIFVGDYPVNISKHDSIEVSIDGALDHDVDAHSTEGFKDGDTFSVPADGRDGRAYSVDLSSTYARQWGRNSMWFSAATNHTSSNTTKYYIVELEIRLSSIWSPQAGSFVGLETGQNDNDQGNYTVDGRLRWQGIDGVDMSIYEPAWGLMYFRTYIEADAGTPQDVPQGTVVTLDASLTHHNHPDFGSTGNFTWTFSYGGSTVRLYGMKPTFRFDIPGEYPISLNVTDGTGVYSTDTVRVGVRDTQSPSVDAGPDAIVDQGATLTFNGTGTTDNDPSFPAGANFTWTFVDGHVVRLYGERPTYVFNDAGEFLVRLQVTDAAGNRGEDTMTVNVKDVESPVAVAGPDIRVDDRQPVTFDASRSTDNVGIAKYVWAFSLRGVPVNLTGRTTVYTFPAPGIYHVMLTVTDYDGNAATSGLNVTVVDITAPEASAGESHTFSEGTQVTLDGSLSFDNVAIIKYDWTISLGGAVIDHVSGERVPYNFTRPGLYDITLLVTDAVGLNSSDTVQYRVLDITRPHADAGGDRTINEGVQVTFDASGSTDNVGILEYNWTIDRAGASRVRKTGEQFAYTFTDPGTYTVTLTVTDAAGNWASDVATVTVKDTKSPVAVPPSSVKITLGQTVVFDGRASHDDVGVTKYVWNYSILGVPYSVEGPNVTQVFDAKGNYTIRLTVFDAAGNNDSATFYVDVVKPKAKPTPGFGTPLAVAAASAAAAIASARRPPRRRGAMGQDPRRRL